MKSKTIFTAIVTVVYLFALRTYSAFQGSLESQIAVNQLDDSALSYGVSNLVLNSNVFFAMHVMFILIIGVMWVPTVIKFIKKQM